MEKHFLCSTRLSYALSRGGIRTRDPRIKCSSSGIRRVSSGLRRRFCRNAAGGGRTHMSFRSRASQTRPYASSGTTARESATTRVWRNKPGLATLPVVLVTPAIGSRGRRAGLDTRINRLYVVPHGIRHTIGTAGFEPAVSRHPVGAETGAIPGFATFRASSHVRGGDEVGESSGPSTLSGNGPGGVRARGCMYSTPAFAAAIGCERAIDGNLCFKRERPTRDWRDYLPCSPDSIRSFKARRGFAARAGLNSKKPTSRL